MDEDEFYAESVPTEGGRKFHWSFPLIRVLAFIASLFGVTGRLFGGLAEDLIEHANYKSERDQFAADASRELEMLVEGPEED